MGCDHPCCSSVPLKALQCFLRSAGVLGGTDAETAQLRGHTEAVEDVVLFPFSVICHPEIQTKFQRFKTLPLSVYMLNSKISLRSLLPAHLLFL